MISRVLFIISYRIVRGRQIRKPSAAHDIKNPRFGPRGNLFRLESRKFLCFEVSCSAFIPGFQAGDF